MYLRAMYLYNVTIIVENDVSDVVKQYLHDELLNEQDRDRSLSLLELLDSPHEGVTYCIQLRCHDWDDVSAFRANDLVTLQNRLNERYPGQIVFFDSAMKYLND